MRRVPNNVSRKMDRSILKIAIAILTVASFLFGMVVLYLLRKTKPTILDHNQTLVVATFVEKLLKTCPIGNKKPWKLVPSPVNCPRCWKLQLPLSVIGTDSLVYGSSVLIEKSHWNVIEMIAETSNWPEWEPFRPPSEYYIAEEDDPMLRQDKYMVSHSVMKKTAGKSGQKNKLVMYRFMNFRNGKATWVLFWKADTYEFWLFHAQLVNNAPAASRLTFLRGGHTFKEQDDCAEFLCRRIMDIKEAVEMAEFDKVPFHVSLNALEKWFRLRQEQGNNQTSINAEQKTEMKKRDWNCDNFNQQLNHESLLVLIPISVTIPVTSKNLMGFSLGANISDNKISWITLDDFNGKLDFHQDCEQSKDSRSSSSPLPLPTVADQPEISLKERESLASEMDSNGDRKRRREDTVFHRTGNRNLTREKRAGTEQPGNVTTEDDMLSHSAMRMSATSRSDLNESQNTTFRKMTETIGYAGHEVPENRRSQRFPVFEEGKISLEKTHRVNFAKTGKFKLLNIYSKEKASRMVVKGNNDEKNAVSSIPINMKNKEDSNEDSSTPEEKFEMLLPPIPFTDKRYAEMKTKGSYCAAELQAEVMQVSTISTKYFSHPSTNHLWTVTYSSKDLTLFTKERKAGSMKVMSSMSKIAIPVKAPEVFKVLRNPQARFLYDETVKKVTILELLPENHKIIYTDHELGGGIGKKEAVDFCFLHTERVEEKIYTVAFTSVEYENCPLSVNSRGMYLPSGWVIQEMKENVNSSQVYFLTQIVVDGKNQYLGTVSFSSHARSIQALVNYIKTAP